MYNKSSSMDAMTQVLTRIIKMSLDPNDDLWSRLPFVVEINGELPYSYTKLKKYSGMPEIHLRRLYDIIHEYLHLFLGCIDYELFQREDLANLSELLEYCFITINGDIYGYLLF